MDKPKQQGSCLDGARMRTGLSRPQVLKGLATPDVGPAVEPENGDSVRVSNLPVGVFYAADLVGPGLDEFVASHTE
jgi:hypothetical protein